MNTHFLPRRVLKPTRRERWHIILSALAGIYDSVVEIASLGYYTTEVRAWVLFDLFPDD